MKLQNDQIKQFYNTKIEQDYQDEYEFKRWFSTSRLRSDYFMTHEAISFQLQHTSFSSCLELGPGPGTWTKMLFRRNKEAKFLLLDISEAMKKQFQLEMRSAQNVDYVLEDIMLHDFQSQDFDLFFSSRAIEYLEDKDAFFNKLCTLVNKNGHGIIITKNSNFGFGLLKKRRFQHTGQLSYDEIKKYLEKNSFRNIKVFPAIIRIRFIDKIFPQLSLKIFSMMYTKEYRPWMTHFVESFIVRFDG